MKETTSIIDAARRLGVSQAEVKRLIAEGKLEATDGRVTLESVFVYKNASNTNQPQIASIAVAALVLKISEAEVDELIKKGFLQEVKGDAIRRGVKIEELRDYMAKKKKEENNCKDDLKKGKSKCGETKADAQPDAPSYDREDVEALLRAFFPAFAKKERRYSEAEMREAVREAYAKGRLSVYEQMQSFQRKAVRV